MSVHVLADTIRIHVITDRPDILGEYPRLSTPRQARGREKRARLRETALAVFGTKGYAATSIADIARAAGLAIGTVYQHVRGKRHLLFWLMDDLVGELSQRDVSLAPSRNKQSAVRQIVEQAFAIDQTYGGVHRAWQELALRDGAVQRTDAALHAWWTTRLRGTVALFQRFPDARRQLDLDRTVLMLDILFWRLPTSAQSRNNPERAQWIEATTAFIYHALFEDPPRKVRWMNRLRRNRPARPRP